MQTELTNAKQNPKLKIKYANRNLNMICKTITKRNKLLEGKDGQMMLTQVQPPQVQVFAQVGDEVDFVVRYSSTSPQATEPKKCGAWLETSWTNLYSNDSPATAPENVLMAFDVVTCVKIIQLG